MWIVSNYSRSYGRAYSSIDSTYCNMNDRLWEPVFFLNNRGLDEIVYKMPNKNMVHSNIPYKYDEILRNFCRLNHINSTTDKAGRTFYVGPGVIMNEESIGLFYCNSVIENGPSRLYASVEFMNKDSIYKNLAKKFMSDFILPNVEAGMQLLVVPSIEDVFVDKVPKEKFDTFEEMKQYYDSLGEVIYNKFNP